MKILKIMVVLMLLLCAYAYAATESGTCGDNLTWELTDGVLTISGTGAMNSYGYYNEPSSPWYRNRAITSVTINNGVTSIGSYAFYNCSNLESVRIPDSVTSVGVGAFRYCGSLKTIRVNTLAQWLKYDHNDSELYLRDSSGKLYIGDKELAGELTLPDGITSLDKGAFRGCSSLTGITIPDSVTSIGIRAFSGCSSLTSVIIPDSVTSIRVSAFYGCSSLTSVIIPDSVTSIGSCAFYGCSSLTSVTIPDSVTSIGNYAFKECSSLISVTVPNSVTSMGNGVFRGCRSLISVTIPDCVGFIGNNLFYDCKSLMTVKIPDGVTYIDNYAFSGCSGLKVITIPDSVTSVGNDAFYNCRSLTDVYYYGDNSRKNSITIKNNNSSLTSARWHLRNYGSCGKNVSWCINADTELYISGTGAMSAYGKENQPWSPGSYSVVTIQEGVTRLSSNAFYGTEIRKMYLPESVSVFGDDIVSCSPVIYCYEFSYADVWANEMNYEIVYLDSISYDDYTSIAISEDAVIYKTETHQFEAAIVPATREYKITWTTSDADVATVDETGLVTAHSAGTATITACYGSNSASAVLTVLGFADVGKLTVSGAPDYLQKGRTVQLSVFATPADDSLNYTWSSSDNSVLTVTQDGEITGKGKGTARVTVKAEGIKARTSVITVYTYAEIGKLTISGVPASLEAGDTVKLSVTADPADDLLVYTWSSSDETVLNVTQDGVITAVGNGTACVTVEAEGVTATTADIVCCTYAKSITLPEEMWCIAKINAAIPCTIEPADAGVSITWTAVHSKNTTVTIADGILYSIMPGDVTVTVTDSITGLTAQTVVHVCYPVTSVTLPEKLTIDSDTWQFECVCVTRGGNYGNELVTYTADNDAVAVITEDGLLTARRTGTVNVTATAIGGQSAVCAVTISGCVTWKLENGALTISGMGDMENWSGNTSVPWCDHITDIISVTIDEGVTSIGAHAFDGCENLLTVTIPASVTSVGSKAFIGCDSLTTVIYGGSRADREKMTTGSGNAALTGAAWVYTCGNIHYCADGICCDCGRSFDLSGLDTLTLPEGLNTIGANAFSGTAAQAIIVPDGCKTIEDGAFEGFTGYISLPEGLQCQLPAGAVVIYRA